VYALYGTHTPVRVEFCLIEYRRGAVCLIVDELERAVPHLCPLLEQIPANCDLDLQLATAVVDAEYGFYHEKHREMTTVHCGSTTQIESAWKASRPMLLMSVL